MNLAEFVETYDGKKVDFDGAFGAQCVDLARQYFKDVLNLPKQPEGVVGARDFYFNHDRRPVQRQYLDCTAYDGVGRPPVGAVVVFGATSSNIYGHVAICLAAHAEYMDVFEQDGFAQDGAKIGKQEYTRLVGWLTRKEAA